MDNEFTHSDSEISKDGGFDGAQSSSSDIDLITKEDF